MIGLYIGALLFGGVLIGASLVFGGGDEGDADHDHDLDHDADTDADGELDHDVDHDVDHDADHDADHGHAHAHGGHDSLWLPFLSLRFWTFAAFAFGATGLLMELLVGEWLLGLLFAVFAAVFIGTATAWLFRKLRQETVTADVGLGRFVGSEARVLLPIRPHDTGKIVIETLAGRVELMARSRDAEPIEPGATVLVASIEKGIADVTALRDTRRKIGARQTT